MSGVFGEGVGDLLKLDSDGLGRAIEAQGTDDASTDELIGGQNSGTNPGDDHIHFLAWLEEPRAVDLKENPGG